VWDFGQIYDAGKGDVLTECGDLALSTETFRLTLLDLCFYV